MVGAGGIIAHLATLVYLYTDQESYIIMHNDLSTYTEVYFWQGELNLLSISAATAGALQIMNCFISS